MNYLLALLCPPLAFVACRKWAQAALAAILFGLAVATARSGLGAAIEFVAILWAFHAVGDEDARREARAFVKTVHQIPVIRR